MNRQRRKPPILELDVCKVRRQFSSIKCVVEEGKKKIQKKMAFAAARMIIQRDGKKTSDSFGSEVERLS